MQIPSQNFETNDFLCLKIQKKVKKFAMFNFYLSAVITLADIASLVLSCMATKQPSNLQLTIIPLFYFFCFYQFYKQANSQSRLKVLLLFQFIYSVYMIAASFYGFFILNYVTDQCYGDNAQCRKALNGDRECKFEHDNNYHTCEDEDNLDLLFYGVIICIAVSILTCTYFCGSYGAYRKFQYIPIMIQPIQPQVEYFTYQANVQMIAPSSIPPPSRKIDLQVIEVSQDFQNQISSQPQIPVQVPQKFTNFNQQNVIRDDKSQYSHKSQNKPTSVNQSKSKNQDDQSKNSQQTLNNTIVSSRMPLSSDRYK